MLDDGVKNGDQQRPGKRQAAPSAGYRVALKNCVYTQGESAECVVTIVFLSFKVYEGLVVVVVGGHILQFNRPGSIFFFFPTCF